jgi:putative ABC transport system permease protein
VRKTTTFATDFGIGLVVFVLASCLMLSAGIERTMMSSGKPSNALVLRKGSDNELSSGVETRLVSLVSASPGVKRDSGGRPLTVGEILVVIAVDLVDQEGMVANLQVRGVPDNVMAVRPEVRIIEGRPAKPGTDEVIIGKSVGGRYKGVDMGSSFDLKKNRPVTVVGVFESGGSSFESEVWCDIETLRTSFGRQGVVSSITAVLGSASAYDGFRAAVENDKQLDLQSFRESAYFEKQSEGTAVFITALGWAITFFFFIGAAIGAMITMYAAVAQRQREIGTLRALGFSRFAILTSFLFEAVVLAIVGGIFGLIASLVMSQFKISMMNFNTWSEVTFSFHPEPMILLTALVVGAGMGLFGGMFPAIRAARTSPIEALRA